jgi:hypothetical protein
MPAQPRWPMGRFAPTALALLLGCSGNIDGGRAPGGSTAPPAGGNPGPGSSSNPAGPTAPAPAGVSAGVAPLRRLNADQYRNTVQDLLGITDPVNASDLPADEAIGGRFTSNVVRPVQGVDVERYAAMAETLARKAVANLPGLLGCDPSGAAEMACVGKFVESFGRRAYRRPLAQAEIDRAIALYTTGRAGADPGNGVRVVVQAMLQSVNFLYLFEPAPAAMAGKVVAVDQWAMASRLSYFLLGSMPDNDLFAAAAANQLATTEQIASQANRLMGTPRFLATARTFHGQWLELSDLPTVEKDPALFPRWNPELRAALVEETPRFVEQVLRQGDGTLASLLSGKFTMLSPALAAFYGVPITGTGWQKVDLDPTQRAGIFTQAGLLATLAHENRTSYIERGKLVREALLCTKVPDPPPGVDTSETKIPATTDARQRAALHRADPACATCHSLFDPIGFAFERYDATGFYRTTENGKPIDTSADLTDTKQINGPVRDAVDLMNKLAVADEVRECVARQWMRFALGREETPADAASLTVAMAGFRDGGWKVSALLASLARSDAFRYQTAKPQ